MYQDDYETCRKTFVTIRIYYDELHPNELTKLLELNPTDIQVKDESVGILGEKVKLNGWFLTSKNNIKSKDSRRHLDFILDLILPKLDLIEKLIVDGAQIDLVCFWSSSQGHGGPVLSHMQIKKLSILGIDFSYDLY